MQKSLNINFMFYAKEILSMKTKTSLSLLYYISTTNNITRKINKKDINQLDIQHTVSDLIKEPYALRLYSHILKGIVRVYILKLKYYESELEGLLNMLKYEKRMKRTSDKLKNNRESLDEEDTIIGENAEDKTNGEMFDESIMEPLMFSNQSFISRVQKDKTDEILELVNYKSTICGNKYLNHQLSANKHTDNQMSANQNILKSIDYPIFDLINFTDNSLICDYDSFESVEVVRNVSSNTVPIQTSSSYVNTRSVEEVHTRLIIEGEDNFTRMNRGDRMVQAYNFYMLLEMISKGEIIAYQERHDTDILILT